MRIPSAFNRKSALSRFRNWLVVLAIAILTTLTSAGFGTAAEFARQRYAVVIGNSAYQHFPELNNPLSDAKLMSGLLTEAGYQVIDARDLTRNRFEALTRRVMTDIAQDSEVLFYYSGHGFQVGSQNYLVPVDARIRTRHDIPFETVSLENLVRIIGSRADLQMFILDSCRDNPFENLVVNQGVDGRQVRIQSGFSFQSAPVNSLIAFSTAPGAVAYDGSGDNSPFTAALAREARNSKDEDIGQVLSRVRRAVFEATGGRQVPWESSSLLEPVALIRSGPVDENVDALGDATEDNASLFAQAVVLTPENLSSATRDTGRAADEIVLASPYEREIVLGGLLVAQLDTEIGNDVVRLVKAPRNGSLSVVRKTRGLMLVGAAQLLPLAAGDVISARELASLRYVANVTAPSLPGDDPARRTERFEVEVGGRPRAITIALDVDPCDLEAGPVLDPQGVGIEVYPHELDPNAAMDACEVAVARAPENARFRYQLGRAYLALKRFSEAEKQISAAAEMGHTRAVTALGTVISIQKNLAGGYLREKESEETIAQFRKGFDLGDPLASYALGRQLLRYGEDFDSRNRGYELLLQSYEVGYVEALNELGFFFLLGGHEYTDKERGLRYLDGSAARDNINGLHTLGLAFLGKLGTVDRDVPRAVDYLVRAADGGHPIAPTYLGRLYADGEGVKADAVKAVGWYDTGLDRGDPWGGTNAANVIFRDRPTGFTAYDGAVRAAKAAVLANPDASKQARRLLERLPDRVLDGAAQQLMADLGKEVRVDGSYGPASERAYRALLSETPEMGVATAPLPRLLTLARAHWERTSFRVDLY